MGRSGTVAAPEMVPPARARTCLIVDDSRMIRKLSRQIVESLGYSVTEAEDGQEALARCQHAMPELILVDWNMPVMGGLEFVTALRAASPNGLPKIVFCTTNSSATDIHKGVEAGASEYVIKPFDHATLTAKLEAIGAA